MKFLIDTQLPPKLSNWISQQGFDSIHTTHFRNGQFYIDTSLIRIAVEQNRIIISKDKDFQDYYFLKGAPPKVLLLQLGNISNRDLLTFFERNFGTICSSFNENSEMIIVSKDTISSYP